MDDASKITGLESVLSLLQGEEFSARIHLVLTTRSYVANKMKFVLSSVEHSWIDYGTPSDEQLTEILNQYFDDNSELHRKISQLANNNPRAAVLVARAIKSGKQEALDGPDSLIGNYYDLVLREAKVDGRQLDSLFIVAIFGRVQFLNTENLTPFLSYFKIAERDFEMEIEDLDSKELCTIVEKKVVGIEDQSVRDFVLYRYLFKSSLNSIQQLFGIIYEYGLDRLVEVLNESLVIGSTQSAMEEVIETAHAFFRESLTEKDKLPFLKAFGSLLPNETIQQIEHILKNVVTKTRVPSFNIDNLNDSMDTNDIIELLQALLHSSPRYSDYVIGTAIKYLNQDQSKIKDICSFVIKSFGIRHEYSDIRFYVRKFVAYFEESQGPITANTDELIYYCLRSFLELRQENVDSFEDKLTIYQFEIDDSNSDTVLRARLWNLFKQAAKRRNIPLGAWKKIVNEVAFLSSEVEEVALNDCKQMQLIISQIRSPSNKLECDLLIVDLERVWYLAGKINTRDIIEKLNLTQLVYWKFNGYSSHHQGYWMADKSVVIGDEREPGRITELVTIIPSVLQISSKDSWRLNENFETWLRELPSDLKTTYCESTFSLIEANDNLGYFLSVVRQYDVKEFIRAYPNLVNNDRILAFDCLSMLQNPSKSEIRKLCDVVDGMTQEEGKAVWFARIPNAYKSDRNVVTSVVNMVKRTANFSTFEYLDKDDSLCVIKAFRKLQEQVSHPWHDTVR